MRCKITNVVRVPRKESGQIDYFILRAVGTQGDASASVDAGGGLLNFMAAQSRVFNFTKCCFPGSEEQADAFDKAFARDAEGNLTDAATVRYVNLMTYRYTPKQADGTPVKFNIMRADGLMITEKQTTKQAQVINGQAVLVDTTVDVPKVFTEIIMTYFCDESGNYAETDAGTAEEQAIRNWNTGLQAGTYIPIME